MVLAAISAIYVMVQAYNTPSNLLAAIEMFIIAIVILLIQTVILIRIYENTR